MKLVKNLLILLVMHLSPPSQLFTQARPMENQEISLKKAKIMDGLLPWGNTNVFASSSHFSGFQGTNGQFQALYEALTAFSPHCEILYVYPHDKLVSLLDQFKD